MSGTWELKKISNKDMVNVTMKMILEFQASGVFYEEFINRNKTGMGTWRLTNDDTQIKITRTGNEEDSIKIDKLSQTALVLLDNEGNKFHFDRLKIPEVIKKGKRLMQRTWGLTKVEINGKVDTTMKPNAMVLTFKVSGAFSAKGKEDSNGNWRLVLRQGKMICLLFENNGEDKDKITIEKLTAQQLIIVTSEDDKFYFKAH
ncbi:hypothetical protein BKI52_33525 [marine bacterium AO1-C]|nr:hypothetical protein BKI52_33525 [marine bacterium AO1-C]